MSGSTTQARDINAQRIRQMAEWVNEIGTYDIPARLHSTPSQIREDLRYHNIALALGFKPSAVIEKVREGESIRFHLERDDKMICVWSVREGWQTAFYPHGGVYEGHKVFSDLPEALVRALSI